MSLDDLEKSNTMDFKDYLNRDWRLQPSYLWVRMSKIHPEKCFRVVSVSGKIITLENGSWLAPIPMQYRRNKNINLKDKYEIYSDIYLPDGQKFLNVLRNRKESSDIVAWKAGIIEYWSIENVIKYNKLYIENQKWKCRYCNTINQGSNKCSGLYYGQLPTGGPPKASNNVLTEYEYFLSKPSSCPPVLFPFKDQKNLAWHNPQFLHDYQHKIQKKPTPCNGIRCVDFSHINQSDQVLSFPRAQWTFWDKTYITNTEQFFLPGAMLGHQTTTTACYCPKCRNKLTQYNPLIKTIQQKVEHSWWIVEILYWLKVDIYNKKMQKLNEKDALKRYLYLKDEIHKLYCSDTKDFIYFLNNGINQSIPFKHILINVCNWINDKYNYDTRFDKKKTFGFIKAKLSLKF